MMNQKQARNQEPRDQEQARNQERMRELLGSIGGFMRVSLSPTRERRS